MVIIDYLKTKWRVFHISFLNKFCNRKWSWKYIIFSKILHVLFRPYFFNHHSDPIADNEKVVDNWILKAVWRDFSLSSLILCFISNHFRSQLIAKIRLIHSKLYSYYIQHSFLTLTNIPYSKKLLLTEFYIKTVWRDFLIFRFLTNF